MMYQNSFNSTDAAIEAREKIKQKKAEEERRRKEKKYLKGKRDSHVDNVVYTIYHNREVGKSDDIINKYEITYAELIAGFIRVYKIKSWSIYLKHMKEADRVEKLFKFRANDIPHGKIIARSKKFRGTYAVLTRGGNISLINEKQLTIKDYKYYDNAQGTKVVRLFGGNKTVVANLMWAAFKNKNVPKHTIIGYKDNDKGNLQLDNLYIKRRGLKGDK